MDARILRAALTALALWPAGCLGQDGPSAWPLKAPGTDTPVGWLRRVDGGPATAETVARARAACLSRRDGLSAREARRVLALAKRDRTSAFLRLNAALSACMAGQGWVTELGDPRSGQG